MKKILLVFLSAVVLIAGCAVPGTYMNSYYSVSHSDLENKLLHTAIIPLDSDNLTSAITKELQTTYKYRVGSYDVLSIVVWDHPELTSSVSQVGTASNITASGQGNSLFSSGGAGSAGASQSSAQVGFFIDADGNIVFPLLGKVHVSGLTVDEVRDLLIKKLSKYVRNPQVNVQVTAFNSQRVQVLGEVMSPGIRSLGDRPLTILDALSLSGGINTNTADAQHVYILRISYPQNISVFWLNAKSPQALLLAEHFNLQNDDIIYVSPAGVVGWNRVLSQIMPTVQTLWFTYSMARGTR